MRTVLISAVILVLAGAAQAAFEFNDDGKSLTVNENGKPVLVYHYTPVAPPEGVDKHFQRACYIHPLYGPDGEVLTQDFPRDHYHHRGLFWAWPECTAAGRRMDVWALDGVRQRHQEWTQKEAGADKAVFGVANIWSFDDAPDKAVVREEVRCTVLPANDKGRLLDFALKFTNVSEGDVTFLGAENKGYGGFCFRPDATRKPMTFTTKDGVCPDDALRYDTPWADISFSNGKGGVSGVTFMQHASNPGYPFPGWIFRHYGFLGASWPHEQTHTLKPGDSFSLQYRVYIHKGAADTAGLADVFAAYGSVK